MDEEEPTSYNQKIGVESGVAYGVIGADLHVWGDGVLLYLLENWHDVPGADRDWLSELPGRLLKARDEVDGLAGRASELSQLHQWRRSNARLAVRWLYGPAGAGKTRLAAKFATESTADNWKVVVATLWPSKVLPVLDSQDVGLGTADGVLLIIDNADHWPKSSLARLLSNKLFRRPDGGKRTRILMIGRTLDDWPEVRYKLISGQPAISSQGLEPHEPEDPRKVLGDHASRGFPHGH
jgi:hypothetical protein